MLSESSTRQEVAVSVKRWLNLAAGWYGRCTLSPGRARASVDAARLPSGSAASESAGLVHATVNKELRGPRRVSPSPRVGAAVVSRQARTQDLFGVGAADELWGRLMKGAVSLNWGRQVTAGGAIRPENALTTQVSNDLPTV